MLRVTCLILMTLLPSGQRVFAQELPPRSAITHAVPLNQGDSAAPLIGCPETGADGLALGHAVARVIKQRFAVDAVVVSAAQINPDAYRQRTVILLGHIANNSEVLWHYTYNYTFADAAYPAGNGYVIRQLHDPVGSARNALVVGASSDVGLNRGVQRFIEELKQLDEPVWTRELIVDSRLDVVVHAPKPLDDRAQQALRKDSLLRMENGQLWTEAHRIIQVARAWYLSGSIAYLQQYDALTLAHQEFTASGEDQFYGGLEFWLSAYIQAWDIVEESPTWNAGQRLLKTQLILDLSKVLASRYGRFAAGSRPRMRWNHETEPAMAYFFLGTYLHKYYRAPKLAAEYLKLAQLVLGDQTQFIRGTDESGRYLPYAPSSALRYAIATRDTESIRSGRVRQFGKLLLMMTDNTGRFVGAADLESQNIAYHYLLPLATVLDDTTFLGLDRKTRIAVEQPTRPRNDWGVENVFGEFRPPRTPGFPQNVPTVESFALEPELHRLTNSEPFYSRVPVVKSSVPVTRAFDKLVFRDGVGKDGAYLLLDGFGRGKHFRYDTMAISRFSADGRVFLIGSDDDERVAETFQNALTFVRDGRGHAHVPPLAELTALAALKATGFSRTTVADYSGINWTRNILWVRESVFVVLDQVEALDAGEYSLRCHWNGLGQIAIDGNTLRLAQGERTCLISGGQFTDVRSVADASDAASRWTNYPHASSAIQRVRQSRSVQMAQGERVAIHNVIYTSATAQPRDLRTRTVSADSVMWIEHDRASLLCVNPAEIPAPFVTDAELAFLSPDKLALARVKSFRLGDVELLAADTPVDVELNLSSGSVVFSNKSRGTVTLTDPKMVHQLTNRTLTFRWIPPPRLQQALHKALMSLWRSSPSIEIAEARPDVTQIPVSETTRDSTVLAALVPGNGSQHNVPLVIGTTVGCQSVSVGSDGQVVENWQVKSPAPVTALARSDATSNDAITLYGTRQGDVVALQPDGQVQWKQLLQTGHGSERHVTRMVSGDLDDDGRDELIVGTANWNVHALNATGRNLWTVPAYARRITALDVGDLNGDGQQDILIGSSYYTLSAYDARGRVLFGYTGEPVFQFAFIRDLDDDQQSEVVVANGAKLLVLDVQRDGLIPRVYHKGMNLAKGTTVRFQFDTGDRIQALRVVDIDQNQKLDIIAGSDSGFIYVFDHQGRLRHMRDLKSGIVALATGRGRAGKFGIAASLEDGRVILCDDTLTPSAWGQFGRPVRWLSMRAQDVVCVTSKSVGVLMGTQP